MKHLKELVLNENNLNISFFNKLINEKQYKKNNFSILNFDNIINTLKKISFVEFDNYEIIGDRALIIDVSENQSLTTEDLLILLNCELFQFIKPSNNKLKISFKI